jgi:glycosyltransferase involved in cell wall biosynthesis
MKTVLFLITTLKRSGPVNILFDLTKYIDKSVYNVHVLTLCGEEGDSRWSEFEAGGVTVSTLDLPRGWRFVAAAPPLRRVTKKIRPDIVHCFGFRSDVLAALLLGNCLKVSSQLNYPFDDYVMTYGKKVGGTMAHLTTWALKRYDHVVACAADVATKLATHDVSAKVVYNAIDDTRFIPALPSERVAARARLGMWDDANLVFIFVGVLSDRKQPLVMLEAFLRFQEQHPRAALIVLGDGPLSATCRELAHGRRVHFAGNVPDTRPYLTASDAYIATSKAEGMPVSVIEALALRLPVVLSDIEPHREILAIDPGAGRLARTGSVEDTLEAMRHIAAADLTVLGDHARRIVDQELSARVMSRKFQALYATMGR